MRNLRNSNGITLVALIVTIIVLLILAGIGVVMLTGENSIIKKSISAKDASSEAEAKEKVELEVLGSLDNKGNIDKEKLKENLRDNLGVQDNQIVDPNDGDEFKDPFDFPLGDYDVRVNPNGDVEIMPKGEIPTPPTLSEGDIIFSPEPSTLTNKEVKVAIKAKVSTMRLTLQYALENPDEEDSWQTYTGPVTMKDNGPIYARLINENGEKSNYTTGNIENIDKQEPTIEEFKVVEEEGAVTSNSVKVTVNANDDRQLASKDTYKFFAKEEGTEEYKLNGTSTESEYTYKDLTPSKTYELKVIVTDEVGNTSEKTISNVQMEMPELDVGGETESPDPSTSPEESPAPSEEPSGQHKANISFKYSYTEWNNLENVNVTIDLTDELKNIDTLKLQYQTPNEENNDWQDYQEGGFKITKNGSVYARLIEKEGTRTTNTASSSYTKFDREQPELSEISITDTTTNSISVSVTATDKPEDNPSGLLEENAYTYIIDTTENMSKVSTDAMIMGEPMGASETLVTESSSEPTHTFTGLTHNTDYTIKVMVMDKAQNIAEQETTQTTEKIPDISQEGELTFDVTPSGWTNKEQATVRINTKEELSSNLKIQYQTLAEENTEWQDYDKEAGFTITKNGTINAKIIEISGEQTSTVATYNYNFFDRKLPEITIETEEPGIEDVKVNITDSKDEESEPGKNDASGLLEENKYTYYIEEVDGSLGEIPANISDETSFTYGSLLQGKQYKVRVEVTDKAGNIGTSTTETITAKTIPDLNDADSIKTQYTPSTWTNAESVKVTLTSKYTEQGYKLQYSTDYFTKTGDAQQINPSATWQDYEDGFNITDNQKFGVRLKLESKYGQAAQYGKVKELEVTWIDRVEPVLSIVGEPEKTTNSITVNVTASDELSQLKDENPIKYYLLEGSVTEPEQIKTQKAKAEDQTSTSETSHQFIGLTQATTYTVVVDAEDKAGNIATQSKVVTTVKVPDLNYGTEITYTYSPDSWTNTPPVTITLNPQNNIDDGFTLQYGTSTTAEEPTVWNNYNSSPFEQSENCTIYTRLKETDGEQVGNSAQHEMKLIDTQEPSGTLKVSSYSTNSLSVEVENPEDTLSGLHASEAYQYSLYEGSEAEGSAKQTKPASTETTAQFTGLTQGKEYTVKVVIKDKAGNTHEATASKTLEKVPNLEAGDITFSYDTNTWTNKASVKVTLSAKDTVDLDTYKLQYQTAAETDSAWHDYPAGDTGFNITTNGSIYARLIEKEGTQTGGTATAQYSWFDRQAPTAALKVTGTTNSNTISVSAEGTIDEVGELTETPYVFSIYQGATAEGVEAKETKPAQAANTASFTGLTHGTQYTIKVEVTDKATNTGSKTVSEKTVEIPDLSQPGTITFTYEPQGNPAENNWSTTDVKVTATPNYLDNSFYKLQMKTDSISTWTDYTSDGYMVETNEKVYAQLVEKNGGTQTSAGQAQGEVTWIDKDAPSVDQLSDETVIADKDTIDVSTSATDTISGVKSFAYYIKEDSGDYGAAIATNEKNQTGSSNKVTDTFQYTAENASIKPSTTYTVKVVVTDNAGTQTPVEKEVKTKSAEKAPSEMAESIGKYVKYEPSGGSTSYSSEEAHNGKELQNIDRETLNWRILSVDGDSVKIISDEASYVGYEGAEGYNNAVKDLNDMCEILYSHGDTKARSVNLDDFTNSQWKSNLSQYSGSSNPKYYTFPNIYHYEYSGSLGQSEQTQWYSGTYTGSSVNYNYWIGSVPDDSPLYMNGVYAYWLSTRCVLTDYYGTTKFYLQECSNRVDFNDNRSLFKSDETGWDTGIWNYVRAVVSLPSNITFGTETGALNDPITLVWEPGTYAGSEGIKILTFKVNGEEFEFENWMTWSDFVKSNYNKDGAFTDPFGNGYDVYYNGDPIVNKRYEVYPIPGKEYSAYYEQAECISPYSIIQTSLNTNKKYAKDIVEGDNIVYYDNQTNKEEVGTVSKVYIHKDASNFVRYSFEDGTYLEATDYHPIYTKEGWKSYTRRNGYEVPKIGDEVKTPTGWKQLTKIETYNGLEDFYDFAVISKNGERVDNYFANGTLVQSSL